MTKMTMTATAIYNEETNEWDVEIFNKYESDTQFGDGKYHTLKSNSIQHTNACDEWVFPNAILKHNGIMIED